MDLLSRSLLRIMAPVLVLTACALITGTQTPSLDEQEVIRTVWSALEPNTSSHDRAAWEVIRIESVTGREVQDLFEGEPVPGSCAPGPTPPDNAPIALDGLYWYVQMKPRPATPQPWPTEQYSPTAPPRVPEPVVVDVHFLVDANTGEITARKLYCVIY